MKRSGKFYRKNEADIMRSLGFEPTPNSGSGWVVKEDGQNEQGICQLKSTDAASIKINLKDLQTLEYNAAVAHKVPIFAIQFLGTNDVWILTKPDMIHDAAKFIETGENETLGGHNFIGIDLSDHEDTTVIAKPVVKSSASAREKFRAETQKKFERKSRSAR